MASLPTEAKPAAAASKPRILIADDSRIVRASLTQHIRDRFDIREVVDGEAAWQAILLDSAIRVVITDLAMPKVDGFEVARRIKADPALAATTVIMLTARGQAIDREEGFAAGANEYLTKPFDPDDLLRRARTALGL